MKVAVLALAILYMSSTMAQARANLAELVAAFGVNTDPARAQASLRGDDVCCNYCAQPLIYPRPDWCICFQVFESCPKWCGSCECLGGCRCIGQVKVEEAQCKDATKMMLPNYNVKVLTS
ncbi:uncharacterized protein LOC110006703 [Amborella trichopoda]|nr:uncharacterized protein LOC110006703 [Amborella trichopoda]|eukprot:XP_020518873.1 uncharacterized protein LOC110006703 [Amborella trichopoda]